MVEPQLVDYIKKAREAGQTDDQTRGLLYKNGWTSGEVGEAFASIDQPINQTKPASQPQPQPKIQPQVLTQQQPQPQPQPQFQAQPKPEFKQQPQPQTPSETFEPNELGQKKSHIFLKLFIVFIILAIIGGIAYFVITQADFLKSLVNVPSVIPNTSQNPVAQTPVNESPNPASAKIFATVKITSVSQEYDISKIVVLAFSKAGDKVVYCIPKITDGKTSCFLNDQVLDAKYSYRPLGVIFSPDGERLILIYSDPTTKQSFLVEDGAEYTRYNGTISGISISDNSQNLIFVVNGADKKSFVVINGKSFTPHDKVYGTPALSADAKYVIYGARDGQDFSWVADEIK